MRRRIMDLPISTSIPDDNEFIVPVFIDNTNNVTKRISIVDLVIEIKKRVIAGESIIMEQVENGIKFKTNVES